jgi:signal transduction histidine kinase/ActR/RegA family two-component response regulator
MGLLTRWLRLTMSARLLIAFAVLLLPLVIFSAWSYQRSLDERRDLALNEAVSTAETMAAIVSGVLSDLDGTTQAMSLALGQQARPLDQDSVGPYLSAVAAHYPFVRALFLMDREGRVIAAQQGMGIGTDLRDRPYTQALLNGREFVLSDLVSGVQSGAPIVTMARTVRGPDGDLRGLLAMAFYPERLAELFPRALPADANLVVLDSRGWVVYSSATPDMAWEQRNQSGSPRVQGALAGQVTAAHDVQSPIDGQERLVAAVPVPEYDWVVSYSRTEAAVEAPLLALYRRQLLALGAVSAGALLVALAVSHSLTRPLRRLAEQARAFGHGDRTTPAPLAGPAEVRTLAMALNQMSAEIDERFAEREDLLTREQAARAEAERVAGRIARLQDVTVALSEALTPEQVMEVITEQGVAAMGAYAGGIGLVTPDGETLEIVRAVGYPPDVLERVRRFPLSADNPPAEAVRTGAPVWVEAVEREEARFPRHAAAAAAGMGSRAIAAIPLTDEGRVIGAIALSFHETRRFSGADRAFLVSLARQCSQALSRARLYEAERTARAEAEAANRAKDEFLSTLSHELRTPLTPILGWAGMLRRRSLDDAGREQALEIIERSARAQVQLVSDLLDVSRIVTGKFQLERRPVELGEVLGAAIAVVQPAAAAKSIAIKTRVDPDVGPVEADPDRLQQVFWNLLSNAVKFTPTGGRIETLLERDGGEAVITVRDSGVGIDPAFLPYVFDRFRQADATSTRRYGGLGLGLAIVRSLVELHGGRVAAASEGEGRGATFTVRLPLAPPPAPDAGDDPGDGRAAVSVGSGALRGVRVLVLDDEADTREFVRALLEGEGATVIATASSGEALAVLERVRPDVVVADIAMPGEDGYQFLSRLRRRSKAAGGRVPVLALTAYAGDGDRRRALEAGFEEHVAKPVDPEVLVAALVRLTGRRAEVG